MMEPDEVVFVALVVTSSAWALLHLSLWVLALRHKSLPVAMRTLAVLPPVTPVAGFMAGARVRAVLWVLIGGAYLVLRTLA